VTNEIEWSGFKANIDSRVMIDRAFEFQEKGEQEEEVWWSYPQ